MSFTCHSHSVPVPLSQYSCQTHSYSSAIYVRSCPVCHRCLTVTWTLPLHTALSFSIPCKYIFFASYTSPTLTTQVLHPVRSLPLWLLINPASSPFQTSHRDFTFTMRRLPLPTSRAASRSPQIALACKLALPPAFSHLISTTSTHRHNCSTLRPPKARRRLRTPIS